MQRALAEIVAGFDAIIIDDNLNFLADDHRAIAVIKANAIVPAVSAASIVAKVMRCDLRSLMFRRSTGYRLSLFRWR